jgi:hypothetical protein
LTARSYVPSWGRIHLRREPVDVDRQLPLARVLLLPETEQELACLVAMLEALNVDDAHLFVWANTQVSEAAERLAFPIVRRKFRRSVILRALVLAAVVGRTRPRLVAVGAQLAHHRLAFAMVPRRIRLLVYNRGLLGDIEASALRSLRLVRRLPAGLRRSRFLNPFQADYSLVLGRANKKMLTNFTRGGLYAVGQYDLPTVLPCRDETPKEIRPVLVTQAFAWHGLHNVQRLLEEQLPNLVRDLEHVGLRPIVRQHPKDHFPYDRVVTCPVSREPARDFIETCRSMAEAGEMPLLVSGPSTLVAEWIKYGMPALMYRSPADVYSAIWMDDLAAVEAIPAVYKPVENVLAVHGLLAVLVTPSNCGPLYCEEDRADLELDLRDDGVI